jgi:hypothetical protein
MPDGRLPRPRTPNTREPKATKDGVTKTTRLRPLPQRITRSTNKPPATARIRDAYGAATQRPSARSGKVRSAAERPAQPTERGRRPEGHDRARKTVTKAPAETDTRLLFLTQILPKLDTRVGLFSCPFPRPRFHFRSSRDHVQHKERPRRSTPLAHRLFALFSFRHERQIPIADLPLVRGPHGNSGRRRERENPSAKGRRKN